MCSGHHLLEVPTCSDTIERLALIFPVGVQASRQGRRIRYVISHYQPGLLKPQSHRPDLVSRSSTSVMTLEETALEVMAVMTSDGDEAVIHAMRLRPKYLQESQTEGVKP